MDDPVAPLDEFIEFRLTASAMGVVVPYRVPEIETKPIEVTSEIAGMRVPFVQGPTLGQSLAHDDAQA